MLSRILFLFCSILERHEVYFLCFFFPRNILNYLGVFLFQLMETFISFQGVGDSSQGFANFVLFCLFTDKIREKFRLCGSNQEKDPLFESTNLTYGAKH